MVNEPIKTLNLLEGTIDIFVDEEAVNPRQISDNVGKIVFFLSRYSFGDEFVDPVKDLPQCKGCQGAGNIDTVPCPVCGGNPWSIENLMKYYRIKKRARVVLPIWLYDHSSVSISCGARLGVYNDPWDSMFAGLIYSTPKTVENCLGKKATLEQIEKALRGEIDELDDYLQGEVYGFVVTTKSHETDSCWGFIGDIDYVEKEAKAALSSLAKVEKSLL